MHEKAGPTRCNCQAGPFLISCYVAFHASVYSRIIDSGFIYATVGLIAMELYRRLTWWTVS